MASSAGNATSSGSITAWRGRGPSLATRRGLLMELAARDGMRCVWCGRRLGRKGEAPTFDHVRLRSAGGSRWAGNLLLACLPCNQERADTPVEEWAALCRERNQPVNEKALAAALRRQSDPRCSKRAYGRWLRRHAPNGPYPALAQPLKS